MPPPVASPRDARHIAKLGVMLGRQTALPVGYTLNVSSKGLLLAARVVLPVGENVHLQVTLDQSVLAIVRGKTVWTQQAPAQNSSTLVGVRLAEASPEWQHFIAGLGEDAATHPSHITRLPRYPVRVPARFDVLSLGEHDATVVNIGPDGLALECETVAPASTKIAVHMVLDNGATSRIHGTVSWDAPDRRPPRMGVRLTLADEAFYKFLGQVSTPVPAQTKGGSGSPAPAAEGRLREIRFLIETLRDEDAFGVLGIGPTDDVALIRQAFVRTARQLHPDRLCRGLSGEARQLGQEVFILVNKAQQVLLDPARRARLIARRQGRAIIAGEERSGPIVRDRQA